MIFYAPDIAGNYFIQSYIMKCCRMLYFITTVYFKCKSFKLCLPTINLTIWFDYKYQEIYLVSKSANMTEREDWEKYGLIAT